MTHKYHHVQSGEDFLTIAKNYNFADYHTVYKDVHNAHLARTRPANQLNPGDVVYIPAKQEKQEARDTGRQHGFMLGPGKAWLRIVVLYFGGEPIANRSYTLVLNTNSNNVLRGTTDANGQLKAEIEISSCAASPESARLCFPDLSIEWTLRIGQLRPVTTNAGLQSRLNNLNFSCGKVDGSLGVHSLEALKEFRAWRGVENDPHGPVTEAVRNRLRKEHEAV